MIPQLMGCLFGVASALGEEGSITFQVLRSKTETIWKSEGSPMPGVPPVEGFVTLTTEVVVPPDLPEESSPLTEVEEESARQNELIVPTRDELYQGTKLVCLSANVFENGTTSLVVYPQGEVDGKPVHAWSNINFKYFSGCGIYRVTQADGSYHDVHFLMGIGGSPSDLPAETPVLGLLTESGPQFEVVKGNADSEAGSALEELHLLFAAEGEELKEEWLRREEEAAQRRAEFLANPPLPQDVTIRFWKNPSP